MTKRQLEALKAYMSLSKKFDRPPSTRELMSEIGTRSKSYMTFLFAAWIEEGVAVMTDHGLSITDLGKEKAGE